MYRVWVVLGFIDSFFAEDSFIPQICRKTSFFFNYLKDDDYNHHIYLSRRIVVDDRHCIYRVFHNNLPKIMIQCSKIKSPGDFLGL